jgi:hypothetical protein
MLRTHVVERIKNTHVIFSKLLFEIRAVYGDNVKQNSVYPDRPQMAGNTVRRMRMRLRAGYKHTFIISDTYCFFHGKYGYANAAQWYVIRTLPIQYFCVLCTPVNVKGDEGMSSVDRCKRAVQRKTTITDLHNTGAPILSMWAGVCV